jgi:uncharacterized protein
MAMTWHDLLFAHWPLPPEVVRPLVPASLDLDVRDGSAWVGVVPFRMSGVRARFLPGLPSATAFPELNLRTYVRGVVGAADPRPGVFFWSLDAASALAVRGARAWFHLPYFDAEMDCVARGEDVAYRSRRTHRDAHPAEFVGTYAASGPEFRAAPGSLEHWLTERYRLYAVDAAGRPVAGDIHHAPWPLQPARAQIDVETLAAAAGLPRLAGAPHLLFARRLDVVAWAPSRADRVTRASPRGAASRPAPADAAGGRIRPPG